jgi:hypothetical protein
MKQYRQIITLFFLLGAGFYMYNGIQSYYSDRYYSFTQFVDMSIFILILPIVADYITLHLGKKYYLYLRILIAITLFVSISLSIAHT